MKKFFALALAAALLFGVAGCTVDTEAAPEATPAVTATPTPTATPEPTPTPTPEPTATPEPTPTPEPLAEELTERLDVRDNVGGKTLLLRDGDVSTRLGYGGRTVLTVSCDTPIHGLYLEWYTTPFPYTVRAGEREIAGGAYGFVHEYFALEEPVSELTVELTGYSALSEIRAFGQGALPKDVQAWEPPCEQADVLVLPAHADDDVIFFGALIASCRDRGLKVQICYLVDHGKAGGIVWDGRIHELLNAMWTLGVRSYPLVGPFPDYYVLKLEEALGVFGLDNVTRYYVEMIRRFRPLVVVGHDRLGEYGHGAHQISSMALEKAVPLAADASAYPASAELYGVWNTPKLYLHFAEENPIFLDVMSPLESFGGMSAYEVAWEAMMYHESQLVYKHRPTLDSIELPRYDCRRFGLVRTTVGLDTGNDIMEHIS